ncbi:MAG: hypothetical protein MJZ39_00290 [Bacteroidales bacterium]|nr:hypothetical protein [Bacteroidales bacterium]
MNTTAIIIAVIVLAGVIAITKMLIGRNLQAQALDNGKTVKGIVLPLRLQAYERMALYLERIEPTQLVMRVHANGLSVPQEQNLLLTAIRSEFEHNLSQQIYISNEVWNDICNAKDDIIDIVNAVAEQIEDPMDGQSFAEALLIAAAQKPVVNKAMASLKADVQRLF